MQQYNNDIENKLRQLENQQLPDLSAMDAHWKEMQAILSPGIVVPRKSSLLKKYLLAAVSIAAIGLIVYFSLRDHAVNKVESLAGNINTATVTNNSVVIPGADTTIKKKPFTLPAWKIIIEPKALPPSIKLVRVDTAITIALNDLDNNAKLASLPGNTAVLLNNFYTGIQKPAQEFIINADKGGEIICKEGSRIVIPPAAFMDGNGNGISGRVTINVTEYYKYSDMITANLTTTSNGQQLVTGGMVKLTAVQNNQEVQLRNDKALNLAMPTKNYDPAMQLFLADDSRSNNKFFTTGGILRMTTDTTIEASWYTRRVNWQLNKAVSQAGFDGRTNFLNMQDEPVRVRETRKKRIGIFHVTNELPMTEEEAKQLLKEKYGDYYTTIKVKKIKPTRKILFRKNWSVERWHIGDSTRLTVAEAIKWHYIEKKDSAFYTQKTKADSMRFEQANLFRNNGMLNVSYTIQEPVYTQQVLDSLNEVYQQRLKVEQAYNFSIKKMGWINCDKFYKYEDKTDFVLDLPADVKADKFVTQIVFTNIRSVMPGQYAKNKIGFLNIPKNMPVYVVGLGERNGKVVSFMQSLKTSGSPVSITELEETTPELFKEKLKKLDL